VKPETVKVIFNIKSIPSGTSILKLIVLKDLLKFMKRSGASNIQLEYHLLRDGKKSCRYKSKTLQGFSNSYIDSVKNLFDSTKKEKEQDCEAGLIDVNTIEKRAEHEREIPMMGSDDYIELYEPDSSSRHLNKYLNA
jgi:hypothetical protein